MIASPILSPPKPLNLPPIKNLSAPIGGIVKNAAKVAPGIGGGIGLFLLKELIAPAPANEGEDEFLRKLKNPYNPSKLVDTAFEQPAPYYGGGVSGSQYKMHIRFRYSSGNYEDYYSGPTYTGKCTWGTPVITFNHGQNSTTGLYSYNWNIPFTYNNGVASSISWVGYNEAKPMGWVKQDVGADVNPPPIVPGAQEQGTQNPVVSGEPPYTNDEFFKKFGAPPRLNSDLFAPPVPGKSAPPQITPVPTGETFPNANSQAPAQAPPITDPAKDVPKINTAPASSDNTYTRTYTKTGSDAWGSTPGIKTYSPGVDNLGLKTPASVKPSSQGGVTSGGGVTPLNPPTTSNPPVIDVPTPSNTDNLITALGSTLALILDQTSKTKIKEATGEAVCEKTSPGQCLSNMFNGKPSWADGLNAGLNAGQLVYLKDIFAFTKSTNEIVKNARYGLEAAQNFAETAWKSLHLDKVLQAFNTVLLIHNAMMLSRNLGESLGDVTSQVLNAFGIKDEKDQPLDVNQIIGDKVTAVITAVIGQEAYTDITSTFNKANRILQAAQGVVWAIRSAKDAASEVGEVLGGWIAKIGNNMLSQGHFEDRSYNWMDEEPKFREHHSKFVDKLDNYEDAVGQVSSLVGNSTEFVEAINETTTNTKTLLELVDEFDEPKETAETIEKTASASPDIANTDLNKKEDDD